MVNYSDGKIYKIINSIDNKIYIGSTCSKYLCKRMGQHRERARDSQNLSNKLYCHMRKLGVEKFKIVLIRKVSAVDKDALEKEEYKEMNKRSPKRLLNTDTVQGQRCEEFNDNIGQVGKDNSQFKRGCIIHRKSTSKKGSATERYCFSWQEWTDGKHKQKSKSFSVTKYGRCAAKQKAIDMQDLIYPH